jgi:hypothetical protein
MDMTFGDLVYRLIQGHASHHGDDADRLPSGPATVLDLSDLSGVRRFAVNIKIKLGKNDTARMTGEGVVTIFDAGDRPKMTLPYALWDRAMGKGPPCFSCDRHPQKYVDGLCEECHQIAISAFGEPLS